MAGVTQEATQAPKRHPRRTETLQGAIGETNPVAELTGLSAG